MVDVRVTSVSAERRSLGRSTARPGAPARARVPFAPPRASRLEGRGAELELRPRPRGMPCRLGRAPLPVVGFSLVRLRPGPAAPAGRGWWILGKPNLRISNLWSSDEPPKVRGGQQRSGASPPSPDVLSGAPRCPRPLSPAAPLWLSRTHDGAPLWLSRTHVPRRRARSALALTCPRRRALRFGSRVPTTALHGGSHVLTTARARARSALALTCPVSGRIKRLNIWPTKRAIRRKQTQSDALKRHARGN